MNRTALSIVLAGIALLAGGCSSYVVPSRGADLATLVGPAGSAEIQGTMSRQPATSFPAIIAAVRIQAPGYHNNAGGSWGDGCYSVVNRREFEKDTDIERLRRLPWVANVAMVNSLVVPRRLESEADLRKAAATIRADMVLMYTFDTTFSSDDYAPPLGLVTLGLFPTRVKSVRTTAALALIDTRTGFVYALADATGSADQLANGWTGESALEDARLRSERRAYEGLLAEFERSWPVVVATYGRSGVAPVQAFDDREWRFESRPPAPVGEVYTTR